MGNGNDIGLLEVIVRVLIIYLLLLASIRIMGKREIGQLSNLDFVVAIVIAELATLPLTDRNLTLMHSIIPMLILTVLQVGISLICLKSNKFRRFLYGRPNLLIASGRLQMNEMRKARYNIDDLMSQLRQKDVFDIAEVEYAVLETSGELTVLLKTESKPITKGDFQIQESDKFKGMPLTLIDDGEINLKGMREHHLTKQWLMTKLKQNGIDNPQNVFFASISNDGTLYMISREEALETKELLY
ncbi:MAG: DUF421 domain-containing protein [Peptococcaceae bacterium]|jgi:uncharacterized membrane protein YcaP (DUF421 family)|nr:DUF421 domain-containing protein [Peptococcaceae bacterium]MBQ5863684.1 DUF421 domain-containing protein [Peptococcaceae bacterium]